MTQSTCSSPLPPASRACQWNFLFNPIFSDSQNLINSGSFHHPTFSLRSLATRILTTFLFAYLHFQKWETLEDLCTPLGRVLLFTVALPHYWLLMMVFTPLGFCVWFLQPGTYCLSLVPLLWLPKTFKYSLYITSLVFKLDRVPLLHSFMVSLPFFYSSYHNYGRHYIIYSMASPPWNRDWICFVHCIPNTSYLACHRYLLYIC